MPDFRYALRQLLKSPGFTIVAVLSLALGIGASTAIFSLVNGVLLGSLPVPYPNELRWLQWSGADAKVLSMTGSYRLDGDAATSGRLPGSKPNEGRRALVDAFTFPQYRALREGSAGFADTGGFTEIPDINVRDRNAVFLANGLMVSDNFFAVLGLGPVAGRLFSEGDERQGAAPSVVISYELWEREFALAPEVIGQGLSLNGNAFTIVGVLPKAFRGITLADNVGFYVSFSAQPALANLRSLVSPDNWWVHLIARVKPGASDTKIQTGFDVLFAPLAQDRMKDPRIVVRSGHAGPTHSQNRYRTSLLTLLSVVGLVVFVACANLAGLALVRSASLAPVKLLSGAQVSGRFFTLPTHPEFEGREQAHKLVVDETFFETMGIPLRIGRNFAAGDGEGAPRVVVVNETFARTYFGNENPIGQILRLKSSGAVDWTVVGVCRDAKYTSVKTEAPPTIYNSFRQDPPGGAYFSVRTTVPPFSIVPSVRRLVADLNPDLPLGEVTTQDEVRDQNIGQERTFALLVGSLAGLAVLLSAIGVYGLMAYGVARRTREIGVRMALGAQRSDISNPVLFEALKLALFGVLLGLPAALLLNRFIEAQLYGIKPTDPSVLAAGIVALFGLTALASWLPARRAVRIAPTIALRSE